MADVRESLGLNEKVSIKVSRYNSPQRKFKRFLGLEKKTPNRIGVSESFKVSTNVDINIRRWNAETQTYGEWYLHDRVHNLKPNVGLTFFLKQCYGSVASGTAMGNTSTGTNFLAVGTSTVAPASGDTTLGTELSTNGFARMQATTTVSQPTATVTGTFTATGTQNSVQEGGLLDASSSGNLGHHFTFTSTNFVANDQLQITVTITIS